MKKSLMVITLAVACTATPAFAQQINGPKAHHNTNTQIGGAGGAGGAGGSSTSVNVNTNTNRQQQGQAQGQKQGQLQGQCQKQSADNKGNKQSVKFESQLIPGVAVAPGLTSGGTQVCLGSFSVGVSGPMAGVAFGKTVIDKGCEDRQNAILLYNMGFGHEALHLLINGNERVRSLFTAQGVPVEVGSPVEPTTAPYQAVTPSEVQGN